MDIKNWITNNTHSLKGKNIAITGSTGGLGKEICKYLAELEANLILMDRNENKSFEHKKELLSSFPNIKVSCININLEDIKSVKLATDKVIEENIDIFIHNAGAYSIPRHKCDTGYDNIYQINFASPYYIINELLPILRKNRGRVIIVGSIAHALTKINEKDIDFSCVKSPEMVYGNSKRFLMFSLYELFKKEKEVKLAVTHPGITLTNITSNYPKIISEIIKYPMKLLFISPSVAALSVIAGVFEDLKYKWWIGPKVLNIWGAPSKKELKNCSNNESKTISKIAEGVYKNFKTI